MARKKQEGGGIPEWMCTYGDLMSLLLCFFIMLFAISIIAEVRYQAVADTLMQDFTGHAGTSTIKLKQVKTTMTPSESAAKSRRIAALSGGQPVRGPEGESPDVRMMLYDGETVKVIRFDLGMYELTAQAKRDLQALLPRLRGAPQKIMVRGYVASSERSETSKQDVDLAFNRALSVEDHFISLGLKREFFEVVYDPAMVPNLNLLPPGTDPKLAGASVEIILLHKTLR